MCAMTEPPSSRVSSVVNVEGVEPDLLEQFSLLEEALSALGVIVWPMVEYKAEDALAAGAALAAQDKRVDRVLISYLYPRQGSRAMRPRHPDRAT